MIQKITALVLCISFLACGGRSPEEVIKDEKGKTVGQISRDNEFAKQLQGAWRTECLSSASPSLGVIGLFIQTFGQGRYTDVEFSFDGNNFQRKQILYSDDSCKTPIAVVTQKGDISRASDADQQRWAQNINFNFKSSALGVSESNLISTFNVRSACGHGNWETGKEQDVTQYSANRTCLGEDSVRTAYEFVVIEGNRLFFGKNVTETDQGKRPVTENRDLAFYKQ